MPTMTDPAIRSLFDPAPGTVYLDAATYGLPPRPTVEAMERALEAWRSGTARWADDWDRPADATRADFASLIGSTAADIAMIPSASIGIGLVAHSLGPADAVVVPEDEHVSGLFPLLVAEGRGVTVRQVPFAKVPDAIEPLIAGWHRDGVLAGSVALAGRFSEAIGQRGGGSSLVCVPVEDAAAARAALDAARIRAAIRGEAIRFSVHVWNDDADVERAAEIIRPFVRRS